MKLKAQRKSLIVKVGECPLHGKELCLCVFGYERQVKGRMIKI